MKEESERNHQRDAIMDHKPAYYDMIEAEQNQYYLNKQHKLKSAWRFQKDRIDEKYKQISMEAVNKTKRGEESWKEYLKYKDYLNQEKAENKYKQSNYYQFLKSQVDMKENKNQANNASPNVFLGAYKVKNSSKMPMVPGINNSSNLIDKNYKANAFRHHRLSYDQLPNTMDLVGAYKTRNSLQNYKTLAPNADAKYPVQSKFLSLISGTALRKSGLSTLGSTDNLASYNKYNTFNRGE